jgi:BppU N-terminal domain
MKLKSFEVTVDTKKAISNPLFNVNTNDYNTVQLFITVLQDGTVVDLTDATVRLAVKKPDKYTVFQDMEIAAPNEGLCKVILDQQAYIAPGMYTAEVMIYYPENKVAVSGRFTYSSVQGILNNDDIQSGDNYLTFNQIVFDTEQYRNEAQLAEQNAKASEQNAKTSELNAKNYELEAKNAAQNVLTELETRTQQFYDEKAQELASEFNERLDSFDAQLAHITPHIDTTKENLVLSTFHKMISDANDGLTDVTYIMVGDSTRAAFGSYIYKYVSQMLEGFNVKCHLSARSGLKAQYWGLTTPDLQPGYPNANDVIELIPGDGTNCMVDICLGINDAGEGQTFEDVANFIQNGIDVIKQSKPNVLINITSPNRIDSIYTEKLSQSSDLLVNTYGYGYIDVYRNVFRTWEDTEGYYLDTAHMNELGQRKVAEYIVSKLIPEYLVTHGGFRLLKGTLNPNDPNYDLIKDAGITVELKYLSGTKPSDELYIKRVDDQWWFYNSKGVASITRNIKMQNGEQTLSKATWSQYDVEAIIDVKDYTVLENYPETESPHIEIINGVVDEFTPIGNTKTKVLELTKEINTFPATIEKAMMFKVLRGHVDKSDPNYQFFKKAGFRIELMQTAGTPITELYIKKSETNEYWELFTKPDVGGGIAQQRIITSGEHNIKKASWAPSDLEFTCIVQIDDVNLLNSFEDTTTRIKLEGALVRELTPVQHLKRYIEDIFDSL